MKPHLANKSSCKASSKHLRSPSNSPEYEFCTKLKSQTLNSSYLYVWSHSLCTIHKWPHCNNTLVRWSTSQPYRATAQQYTQKLYQKLKMVLAVLAKDDRTEMDWLCWSIWDSVCGCLIIKYHPSDIVVKAMWDPVSLKSKHWVDLQLQPIFYLL
jgi:hypothetical protein